MMVMIIKPMKMVMVQMAVVVVMMMMMMMMMRMMMMMMMVVRMMMMMMKGMLAKTTDIMMAIVLTSFMLMTISTIASLNLTFKTILVGHQKQGFFTCGGICLLLYEALHVVLGPTDRLYKLFHVSKCCF